MATILLVDDDTEVLDINAAYLKGEGFNVLTASNAVEAITTLKSRKVDLVVMDVMMDVIDGFQACERIRTFSQIPIIFLTGKGTEDDKVNGLVKGADDYMVKPYSLKELKARIDVLLRRAASSHQPVVSNKIVIGNLTIDKLAHKAFFKGQDLELANREYEVLLYMAEHPNKDVTFEELGVNLWGTYLDTDRRAVMVNVSRLRKKMDFDFELSNMLETIWSKGYRFIAK